MDGNAQVPVACRACRRPVPTVSKVRGRSNVPVLELANFTTKRIDSPERICPGGVRSEGVVGKGSPAITEVVKIRSKYGKPQARN